MCECRRVRGLGDDYGHQAVFVGDLLRVARLQGCQCRQKTATHVHETKDVGNPARLQLVIKAALQGFILVDPWFTPGQRIVFRVEFEMFESPHTQILVERFPQPIQLVAQGIDHGVGRLAQPGNVEVLQRFGLALQFHQFVAEAAVPDTVVEVNLAGGQTFAELPIDPEFIAIPAKAGRLAGFVGIEEVGPQSFWYGSEGPAT